MPGWAWTPLADRTPVGALIRALNLRMARQRIEMRQLIAGGAEVGTFLEGDATPSVAGARLWLVRNAGATSITALHDGAPGDEKLLWSTTANTTLVHSAALLLKGGVNVTLTAAETRRFATLDGLAWRET